MWQKFIFVTNYVKTSYTNLKTLVQYFDKKQDDNISAAEEGGGNLVSVPSKRERPIITEVQKWGGVISTKH